MSRGRELWYFIKKHLKLNSKSDLTNTKKRERERLREGDLQHTFNYNDIASDVF